MNKEDKLILGTLAGVDLVLSSEHYEEYKDTLNKQLEQKDKEIDRLNNIINELEKWCNETMKKYKIPLVEQNKGALGFTLPIQDAYQQVLDKLKALKEDNK